MLPPTADITRMTMVEMPPSCARVRHSGGEHQAEGGGGGGGDHGHQREAGRWPRSGRPKTSAPQTNITVICTHAEQR